MTHAPRRSTARVRRILFPTDFSPAGDTALRLAASLAGGAGAELMIVHVGEPADADAHALRKELEQLEPTDPPFVCSRHLVLGDPAPALRDFALAHDVDLIVIGTHGRTGIASLLVGSVAEELLRAAPCPVLAIKMPANGAQAKAARAAAEAPPTNIDSRELRELLERLVTACADSAQAFLTAAADLQHEELRILLTERAEQRAGFAEELQTHAIARGPLPQRSESMRGTVRRTWMHLRSMLGADASVLDACLRVESETQRAYQRVLACNLPEDLRPVIERQAAEVEVLAESLRSLQELGHYRE